MSDLIRRQDALDAFGLSEKTRKYGGDHSGYATVMLYEVQDVLESLPSTEPERKKGYWVKINGYCTPGGDPVWRCSECGKGIHVYGIEANTYNCDYTDGHQWVACPNCGADMIG